MPWLRNIAGTAEDRLEALSSLQGIHEAAARSVSWVWDPANEKLAWSPPTARLLDVKPGEGGATVQRFLESVHDADRPAVADVLRRAMEDDGRHRLSYRLLTPERTTVLMHSVLERVVVPGDRVLLVGVTRDVTEGTTAEREIAAHTVVSEVLGRWRDVPESGELLLFRLGTALGFDHGTMWVPREDCLEPVVSWRAQPLRNGNGASPPGPLQAGEGIEGRAWRLSQPVVVDGRPGGLLSEEDPSASSNQAAAEHGSLAIPAVCAAGVVAVISLKGHPRLVVTDRFVATLTGLGHEIGTFLSVHPAGLASSVLTPRELEVLQLAADGHPGTEIAKLLFVSPATVKTHFEHIYAKYGVQDRVAAVAKALRAGLIR